MWVVRPVRREDHASLTALATSLGPGMTTLPSDADAIAEKIETAVLSFQGQLPRERAQYLMVLEDPEVAGVLGVAAVYPSIGRPYGFFSYHVNRLVHHAPSLDFSLETRLMQLSHEYTGLTEVGTLAVSPAARRGGAGRLLAQSRYMLMAALPDLFADRVIAEMRGWQEEDGTSPFWSAVGERFFHLPFEEADRVSAVRGAEFIADLMPKHPIYLDLLPEAARRAVGRAHSASAVAMSMLLDEGFRFENCVDVFDAGPQVVCPLARIRTVAEARTGGADVVSGAALPPSDTSLVATRGLETFRVVRAPARVEGGAVRLGQAALDALGVGAGETLCLAPIHHSRDAPASPAPSPHAA